MNHYLYLFLNLASLSIPLFYSIFERKFHFIQYFKAAFISILLVSVPFLVWDGIFTSNGIWGFNPEYYLGVKIIGMPFEEWMFFFCIPYACLFTHEVLKYYLPNFKLSRFITLMISFSLVLITGILFMLNFGKWYTTINFALFVLLILYGLKYHVRTLQEYYPSFLVILVPFLIVNGVLTGSFIDEPVVWYDNSENLGIRIFTIPVEDIFYAFVMLFSIQLIFNTLKKKYYA
ncbi:lycopene cyclase domain-containing protein [Maribacter sp. HTCC2170]|uniref:lycopene cyclase domain-containing protein n=1 Tax=Maribacter sp. (strain HTCC2170 / KCCM 42371) TaxID=313603 RepID=UPI00030F789E|nr:lycopene cyclase domain-containing protein [Maribacter sp. HTCC2170]